MAGEGIPERIESESPGGAEKSKEEILAEEIQTGLGELERSTSGLFLSALSAGLDIGFGPLFMAVAIRDGPRVEKERTRELDRSLAVAESGVSAVSADSKRTGSAAASLPGARG